MINVDDEGQNHTQTGDQEAKGGVSTANTDEGRQNQLSRGEETKVGAKADEGGQKHTLSGDKETKGGVSTPNTDEGGQKYARTRDQEAKGVVSTVNAVEGGQSTHKLETRRQRAM